MSLSYRATSPLQSFIEGYTACACWLTHDEDGDPIENLTDKDFDYSHELAEALQDCTEFFNENRDDIDRYLNLGHTYKDAGGDFFLTRNRHGTGFWDRSYDDDYLPVGERLTNAAHVYGGVNYQIGGGFC